MTPEILNFLKTMLPNIGKDRTVFEVGSYNVNGTAKSVLSYRKWMGVDIAHGPDVDHVVKETEIYSGFLKRKQYYPDTFVCCECLEHTRDPIAIVSEIKKAMKMSREMRTEQPDAYKLIITTPGYHFQYHPYPRDYWRFSVDTFQDVLFDGLDVMYLGMLDSNEGKNTTVAGIATLPS
jgi:hypothetical protein